jgi:hypothetical protein
MLGGRGIRLLDKALHGTTRQRSATSRLFGPRNCRRAECSHILFQVFPAPREGRQSPPVPRNDAPGPLPYECCHIGDDVTAAARA